MYTLELKILFRGCKCSLADVECLGNMSRALGSTTNTGKKSYSNKILRNTVNYIKVKLSFLFLSICYILISGSVGRLTQMTWLLQIYVNKTILHFGLYQLWLLPSMQGRG
jgi:hypothetical protein